MDNRFELVSTPLTNDTGDLGVTIPKEKRTGSPKKKVRAKNCDPDPGLGNGLGSMVWNASLMQGEENVAMNMTSSGKQKDRGGRRKRG